MGCQSNAEQFIYETDLKKGLELGAKNRKPIFIYFSCFGCMGYDEFMNSLISSDEIFDQLDEEFISVILYVDDKSKLDNSDLKYLKKLGFVENSDDVIESILTKGKLNHFIQVNKFGNNVQPMYSIINSKGEILIEPFGYTQRSQQLFLEKLNEGLMRFDFEN